MVGMEDMGGGGGSGYTTRERLTFLPPFPASTSLIWKPALASLSFLSHLSYLGPSHLLARPLPKPTSLTHTHHNNFSSVLLLHGPRPGGEECASIGKSHWSAAQHTLGMQIVQGSVPSISSVKGSQVKDDVKVHSPRPGRTAAKQY